MEKSWVDIATMVAAWAGFALSVYQLTVGRSLERVTHRHEFVNDLLALRQRLQSLIVDAKDSSTELRLLPLPVGNDPRVLQAADAAFDVSVTAKQHAKQLDGWLHRVLYEQKSAGSAVQFKEWDTELAAMRSAADQMIAHIDQIDTVRAQLAP